MQDTASCVWAGIKMDRSTKWNVIKNLLLIAALAGAYPVIKEEFSVVTNPQTLNTILLFVGLILVAPLFANFQFSYQFSSRNSSSNLLVSHITTFLAMLVCGLLVLMIDVIFLRLVGHLFVFRLTLLLFLTCMILWDFYDFQRLPKA